MKNSWMVIVNSECSTHGGDIITCENRSKAVNIASFVSRVLYNSDIGERHIFVVKKMGADYNSLHVFSEDSQYTVVYHYSIMESDSMKWMFLYDGWCNNKKKVCCNFKMR